MHCSMQSVDRAGKIERERERRPRERGNFMEKETKKKNNLWFEYNDHTMMKV